MMPKHAAVPSFAIISPARAGPTIRARFTMVEFSEMAFVTFSGPTRSIKNACRAGISSVCVSPNKKLSRRMCQYRIRPVAVSSVMAAACAINSDWVSTSSFCLGNRSATTPAKRERNSMGRNCATPTSPTSRGELVTE